jgi:hypothetical protein
MRFLRYLPFFAAVLAGLSVLAGAGQRGGAQNAPVCPFTPPPRAVPDPVASQALDGALAALEPRCANWIETTVRQKIRLPDLEYDAEGRFQAAPDNRFRLELQTRIGSTRGTLLAVGDGTSVWRANRIGDGGWGEVHRVGMKQVLEGLAAPQTKEAFLHGPTFSGPEPLLRNLRRSMVWVKRAVVVQGDRHVVELTAVWPEALSAALAASSPWPQGMPDRCRLILDADTFWPRRVEWWGLSASGNELVRLVQMELRDPVLNRPLSTAECARTFSFDPGSALVCDETAAVREGLTGNAGR